MCTSRKYSYTPHRRFFGLNPHPPGKSSLASYFSLITLVNLGMDIFLGTTQSIIITDTLFPSCSWLAWWVVVLILIYPKKSEISSRQEAQKARTYSFHCWRLFAACLAIAHVFHPCLCLFFSTVQHQVVLGLPRFLFPSSFHPRATAWSLFTSFQDMSGPTPSLPSSVSRTPSICTR